MRSWPLLLCALLVAGCGKGEGGGFSARASAGAGATFRTPLKFQPTTLDPGVVGDVDTTNVMQNVYEGLVAYDEHNKIVPLLAESWTLEDGGKTYVFKLRDAKFSNGRAVTAADFKWTFERNADRRLASPVTVSYLGAIVGLKEVAEGKAKEIRGVTAPDDRTLRITLDKPRPYFLGNLTYPCASVLAKEAAPSGSVIKDVASSVGTGPFKFKAYIPAQEIELDANEGYWDGAPSIKHVALPVMLDSGARLAKYKNGEFDMLALTSPDLEAANSDPALKAQRVDRPNAMIGFFGLNEIGYAPFKDKRVRRAFGMAIDRKKIATVLSLAPFAAGFIPPGVPGHRKDLPGIPFDPAGARKLLAEAGFPGGKGLPPLTLTYIDATAEDRNSTVAAVEDLRKNLGFEVEARPLELGTFLDSVQKHKLGMYNEGWYADYLDPQDFLSFLFASNSDQNRDGYANRAFDALAAKADSMPDGPERIALYQQAEDILVDDAARLPIRWGVEWLLVSPRVKGLRMNAIHVLPLNKVTLGP